VIRGSPCASRSGRSILELAGYFDEPPKEGKSFLGIPIPFTRAGAKYDREKAKKDPVYALSHRAEDEAAWARSKMAQDSIGESARHAADAFKLNAPKPKIP
jgi:hypothetical protein